MDALVSCVAAFLGVAAPDLPPIEWQQRIPTEVECGIALIRAEQSGLIRPGEYEGCRALSFVRQRDGKMIVIAPTVETLRHELAHKVRHYAGGRASEAEAVKVERSAPCR